jgi:hypothetical protein
VSQLVVGQVQAIVMALVDRDYPYTVGATFDTTISTAVPDTIAVEVKYPLTVFICNGNTVEVTSPPTNMPNGVLQVCILYTGAVAGVEVGSVYSSTIDQTNGFSLAIVQAGTIQQDFMTVDCTTVARTCRIKTNIVRNFFALDENNLTISGTVPMEFGRRRMESLAAHHFSLPFKIQNESESESLTETASGARACVRDRRLTLILMTAATASYVVWEALFL